MTQTPDNEFHDAEGILAMLLDAMHSLTDGIALYDGEHRLVYCNQAYKQFHHQIAQIYEPGVSREQIVREEANLVNHHDATNSKAKWIEQHLSDSAQSYINTAVEHLDGTTCLKSTFQTQLGGLVTTCRDFSEDRRAQEEKHKSDDLVRMVLETSASAVMMSRLSDGHIIYRSPAAEEMYGIHRSAVSHFADPSDRQDYLGAILPTGKVDDFKATYRRANGEIFTASNAGRVAEYRGEKVIVSNVTDITRQVEADELIRTVLDASSAVISMVNLETGKILYRTPGALKFFGDSQTALESYVRPNDRAEFVRLLGIEGHLEDFKSEFVNSEGQHIPVSLSSRLIDFKDQQVIVTSLVDLTKQLETEAVLRKVLEACPVPVQMTNAESGKLLFRSSETKALFGDSTNAKNYYENPADRTRFLEDLRKNGWVNDFRCRFVGSQGKSFWGSISARLIEFNDEDVIVSNTRDLTNDLALEEELSHQRELLYQNEKMSALGELLAGVAHELNNPLSIVVGNSLLLQEEAEDPETVRRVKKISTAADRCAKIVKTFLAMARQQPARLESTDINSIISDAVEIASYGRSKGRLSINSHLAPNLPDIVTDGDQLTQVIINLLINARQAITNAGTGDQVTISTSLHQSGDSIRIDVEDNGPGVPSNIQARIFEPFFTTKDVGEGTGIGLAFCFRTIRTHQGRIWIDPHFKNGSRFVISLPILPLKTIEDEESDAPVEPITKLRVLVVDDETEVAELISEILTKEGMKVDCAASGDAALDRIKTESYDLLFTDVNMPKLSGLELYEALKTDHPELLDRIGFITGDSLGSATSILLQGSEVPCLEKPITPNGVRTLVRNILGS